MAAGDRHGLDDEGPDLARELLELLGAETPEIGRPGDGVEQGGDPSTLPPGPELRDITRTLRGLTGDFRGTHPGESFAPILEAARADAPWAYARLYEWLAGPVAGYLRAQGAPDADDLTSEVFLGVFQGLGRFEGTAEQFRSWVFTIAHRRLTDDRRRRGRRGTAVPLDEAAVPAVPGADGAALDRLGGTWVTEALAGLAPDQRDVLLLRVLADLTGEQVADALGTRPGAVKALQRRGLAALRRKIDAGAYPSEALGR